MKGVISVTLKTGERRVLKVGWADDVVAHLKEKHNVDMEEEVRDVLFTTIPRILKDEGVFIRDIISINLERRE